MMATPKAMARLSVRRPARANEAARATEDLISEHRNHVSNAVHVKAVCWRGSPDLLQLSRSLAQQGSWEKVSPEASRGRARCAVVRTGQAEETDLSDGSSNRLCRVHPALVQTGRSGGAVLLPSTPSGADDSGSEWGTADALQIKERLRARLLVGVRLFRLSDTTPSPPFWGRSSFATAGPWANTGPPFPDAFLMRFFAKNS